MKNVLVFLFLTGLVLSGFSQNEYIEKCFVNNAVKWDVISTKGGIEDFTITDSDGNTWNLYEQLDLGKTVFLDLFETG
ncbi:MAG: hypothetical protein B6D61_05115 [Bacteroidetes bacterium 4484_249]|nr:MAG: hypothetical protein B6D61_05115 [Bacteroidetes bacterium 4484_249]